MKLDAGSLIKTPPQNHIFSHDLSSATLLAGPDEFLRLQRKIFQIQSK
jgi:hypothetical protein